MVEKVSAQPVGRTAILRNNAAQSVAAARFELSVYTYDMYVFVHPWQVSIAHTVQIHTVHLSLHIARGKSSPTRPLVLRGCRRQLKGQVLMLQYYNDDTF